MKVSYTIENLNCAHCAAKIEEKIQSMPEVQDATLTFATKKLEVEVNDENKIKDKLLKVATSVEADVNLVKRDAKVVVKTTKKNFFKDNIIEVINILGSAILFVVGLLTSDTFPVASMIIFLVAYLALGFKIILHAIKNILKGQVFDENFLMSVATIAAIAIGDYAEAVGIMLFYRVGELFEEMAVDRSRSQIMEAVDLRPEEVVVLHDHGEHRMPSEEAKVGDVILVKPGDRIPLDGVVVEGKSRVDTSPITGEPVPVSVRVGANVVSGCINEQGVLKVKVEKVLADSMVSRILESVENAAANKPKMDRFITRFAKIYTPIVVLIALITAIVPSLITGNWNHWIYTAVTFLVISCPCALVISVPLSFFSGIGAASKRGILFKGGLAIESLAEVSAVVMDKTGTLTKGNFTVKKVVSSGALTQKQILTMAADSEQFSTHPIGYSILEEAGKQNLQITKPENVEEISGRGIKAKYKEGEILVGNEVLMNDNGVDLHKYTEKEQGTIVLVALNNELQGWLLIDDTIKDDADVSIDKLHSMGIHTAILTGDSIESAQAVGSKVGVKQIFAKLLPDDKLNKLRMLRDTYGKVMFVGDGINDAPVLAGADVGAAMGSGADAAIEAADVVFMNSKTGSIPKAINIAKATGVIAKENVIFALGIKAIVMILGFLGMANMWFAVFADTGVAMICILNSIRMLYKKFD
ncbi:MAG: heavy metal translocating P-type ATPase [Suipraeoptans sp.]